MGQGYFYRLKAKRFNEDCTKTEVDVIVNLCHVISICEEKYGIYMTMRNDDLYSITEEEFYKIKRKLQL